MTWTKKAVCAIVALTLALASVCVTPVLARADLESDLAAAEQRLNELGEELAVMQDNLVTATEQLEETDNRIGEMELQIADTQTELDGLRQVLANRMRSSYKAGAASVLEFILGSTSVDDFVSRVYYMDKITENDAATIARVVQLKFDLEQQKSRLEAEKAEQEARVADMEAQVAEYEDAVAEAQAYYNSLDQQLREELARRAEEERRAAEAAAAAAAQQAQAQEQQTSGMATAIDAIQTSEQIQQTTGATTGDTTSTSADTSQGGGADTSGTSSDDTSGTSSGDTSDTSGTSSGDASGTSSGDTSSGSGSSSSSGDSSSSSSSGSSSSSSSYTGSVPTPGGGLATAYACIGYPYIWGACGYTSDGRFGFDCGGLVYYCYLGYRAGTAGTIGRAIQANGTWVDSMDQLNVGDCVFTAPGFNHIGIYIGNGQMIHAPNSSKPVMISSVYAFYGGGPFAT